MSHDYKHEHNRTMAEHAAKNEADRKVRGERIRKMLVEGLNTAVIGQRTGLKNRTMKQLRRLAGLEEGPQRRGT